ncbi:MAG TPA: GNAT family N-acetyltransferase [Ferruginibacter sp.]|nr:GNAT family N-acetyltransferase [Ferruginibacter sp.]
MEIKYLTNDTIDKQKWDACIANADNSLVYAYSFYLDAMAEHWDALIVDDYEVVMPLTWEKKYGISYLYQPPFTQQLGIFSSRPITTEIQEEFIATIKKEFSFVEIFLNTSNGNSNIKQHTNLILPINTLYANIRANYKTDLLKNLKHTEKFSLRYMSDGNYDEAIDTYIKEYADRTPHVKDRHYSAFRNVCKLLAEKKMLFVRKTVSADNKLLAIALLLKDKKRIYNIMSTVLPAGRKSEANHFLFDELIKEFAGKIEIVDFEGSDIERIATFYKKFGAVNEPYYYFRYNNLPWPLHYFKK